MASFTDARKAYSEGRFEEAAFACREILAASPSNLDVKLLLGASEIRGGNVQSGVDLMEELAAEEPELFETQIWLTTAYRKLGNPDKSLEAATSACRLRPYDANARNNLGLAQKDLVELPGAAASFRRATEIDPKQPIYRFNLGSVLLQLGRVDEASGVFDEAVVAASCSAEALIALGKSLLDERQFVYAEACGRKAVEVNGTRFEGRMLWAQGLMELGKIDQAKEQVETAIQLAPTEPDPYTLLGSILNRKGLIREAEDAYRKSISVQTRQGHAYLGLAQAAKFSTSDSALIEEMRDLASDSGISESDRESLHYALGKAYENLLDYESAMRHYDEGNAIAYRLKLSTGTFDRKRFAEGIESTSQFFDRNLLEKYREIGEPTDRPIFIVGMVRSGTTLVEQIVSAHPDVEGAGEVEFWASQGVRCFDAQTGNLHCDILRDLTSKYLDLLERSNPGSKYVTDKMPANLLALGLIHLALPNARIILMRRNPIDTCLSIYTTANRAPVEFYHDKGNIAFAFELYAKIADHWRELLPADRLLTVDYEELVAKPNEVIPAMIDFCGLPWDARCLRPQENDRIVTTPSATQVRQPINRGSIGRWRRFEPWLGEFRGLTTSY